VLYLSSLSSIFISTSYHSYIVVVKLDELGTVLYSPTTSCTVSVGYSKDCVIYGLRDTWAIVCARIESTRFLLFLFTGGYYHCFAETIATPEILVIKCVGF
jgi:hypothetical protein